MHLQSENGKSRLITSTASKWLGVALTGVGLLAADPFDKLAVPLENKAVRPPALQREVLFRTVDLSVNEVQDVELADKSRVRVKLVSVDEKRDTLRKAVREAVVKIEIDGSPYKLTSANYHLPVTCGGVQVDCPVTGGVMRSNMFQGSWAFSKDARLRFWPAGSTWFEPGKFAYPVKQRWFANHTQMVNEPAYVDDGDIPSVKEILYHWCLDFGGTEGMDDVLSTVSGRVASVGKRGLPEYNYDIVEPFEDLVQIVDERGWHHVYMHLQSVDPAIRLGSEVRMGQKIGVMGKEGASGGWTHLHYEIWSRQPSGEWGALDAYAFAWEAYQREYAPKVLAVARPHHLLQPGESVTLDGSKSWSASGNIASYAWTFTDGSTATTPKVERTYREAGEYSEKCLKSLTLMDELTMTLRS